MIEKIYGVARNGLMGVKEYKVLKETEKTYKVEGCVYSIVKKSQMITSYMMFFTERENAEKAYNEIVNPKVTNFYYIKKMTIEQLAHFLCVEGFDLGDEKECLNWLKEERRDGGKDEAYFIQH